MMKIADDIRNLLTMQQVAEFYGFPVGRSGFISCPFHPGDDTPSMKIYPENKGFHCFACGAHGSVIDFVMRLYNISFQQAVIRLSADFNLGLTIQRPSHKQVHAALEARKAKEDEQAQTDALYWDKATEYRSLWEIKKEFEPTKENMYDPNFLFHPMYAQALHRLPALEYWLDSHMGR